MSRPPSLKSYTYPPMPATSPFSDWLAGRPRRRGRLALPRASGPQGHAWNTLDGCADHVASRIPCSGGADRPHMGPLGPSSFTAPQVTLEEGRGAAAPKEVSP